jgi:hypothetical protein
VPQSRSGFGGEEKNSQPLPGLEAPDHPARSPAPSFEDSIRKVTVHDMDTCYTDVVNKEAEIHTLHLVYQNMWLHIHLEFS